MYVYIQIFHYIHIYQLRIRGGLWIGGPIPQALVMLRYICIYIYKYIYTYI
jgi:hypothetical protein